ncbi:MAG: DUF1499 domain-containing protein [Methylococcales bacterium]|nr:DUF1499 domain-containing protein [Methylococcales bacterium]
MSFKGFLLIGLIIVVVILILGFMMAFLSKNGDGHVLIGDKLPECPDKPNCLCSEYAQNNHWIEPLSIDGLEAEKAWHLFRQMVEQSGGDIRVDQNFKLHAVYTTSFFKFNDDLMARLDNEKKLIHLRSESRIGHSDFGKNKQRLQDLCDAFYQKARP